MHKNANNWKVTCLCAAVKPIEGSGYPCASRISSIYRKAGEAALWQGWSAVLSEGWRLVLVVESLKTMTYVFGNF